MCPGGVSFVTDGRPVVFRDFVTRLLGRGALPLPGRPPLTRLALWLSALEATIDITRARAELGYAPVTTVDEGMRELSSGGIAA
jgi:nucleoside-diphosphate-sugar epimerase